MKTFFMKSHLFMLGKRVKLLLLLCLMGMSVIAQDTPENPPAKPGKLSLGLSSGTHATFGIDLAYRVMKPITLRVGYNAFNSELSQDQVINDLNTNINVAIARNHLTGLVELAPTKRKRLRLVAGVGYFLQNDINLLLSINESASFNDVELTPEDIGVIDGTATFQTISPYLGIGFGRSIQHKKRLSLSLDFGGYYMGDGTVLINATNFLKNNVENQQVLQDNLAENPLWWPVASLRLGFKIR